MFVVAVAIPILIHTSHRSHKLSQLVNVMTRFNDLVSWFGPWVELHWFSQCRFIELDLIHLIEHNVLIGQVVQTVDHCGKMGFTVLFSVWRQKNCDNSVSE